MTSFKELELAGLYLVENYSVKDIRGRFIKTIHAGQLSAHGFNDLFRESYYSTSSKGVLRGMHFQVPPHQHDKLVYVTEGSIQDVVLDMRQSSPTFGKFASVQLNEFGNSIMVPKGCAHGFLTLSESATVVYNVTTEYNPGADMGILWNSFGFNWGIKDPVLSERDRQFKYFDPTEIIFE